MSESNEVMAVDFTDEDNRCIAAIDLSKLKAVLPPSQFAALSKLISCIQVAVDMNDGGAMQ